MVQAHVISTRNLSLLPDVVGLRRTLQSMAMLDAMLCPEWQYRYYSFNAGWADGEQLGSMRNGSGDNFFAHFGPVGCWLKGFAPEAAMTPYRLSPKQVWRGVLDSVPREFAACMHQPAFSVEDATFCIWRRFTDAGWQLGQIAFPSGEADPDGSAYLLSSLDGQPETYRAWALEYYERELPFVAVDHVYQHRPLTPQVVAMLNRELSLDQLLADMNEIGYPG